MSPHDYQGGPDPRGLVALLVVAVLICAAMLVFGLPHGGGAHG